MALKLTRCDSADSAGFLAGHELKTKIGEGSFSDVWLCVRRDTGQRLAAKVLKKTYKRKTADADAWRGIAEVRVANTLDRHPFLLTTDEAYYENDTGRVVLVAELMERSLYDVIAAGECPVSDYRIKTHMYQMLEGLKYLHQNGFIHRDIKPENVLLRDGDRMLKIGDFGTACRVSAGHPRFEYVATRWYRSPECLLTRGRYGATMDVWATGCVLYELATGLPLFDGENEFDQLEKIDRVLGSPDSRLVDRFRKHKSEVFTQRYGTGCARSVNSGVGLDAVYPQYRPAYDLLKDMMVYDPKKRFSAERLLGKSFFDEMRGTLYEQRMTEVEGTSVNKATNHWPARMEKLDQPLNKHLAINENQGPDGDSTASPMKNMVESETTTDVVDEFNTLALDNQNQITKLCLQPRNIYAVNQNRDPKKPTQKPGNVNQKHLSRVKPIIPEYKKMDLNKVMSKVNCWLDNKHSTTPTATVTTSSRVSVIKNGKNNLVKRQPFK